MELAISSKKLGMWLFIASDSFTFAVLMLAYINVGASSVSSTAMGAIMTLVLLASSLTMSFAVKAAKKHARRHAVRFLLLTMLGGLSFLILHLSEWRELINAAVRVPLTGLHMAHVAGGFVYLAVVARGFSVGRYTPEDVEVSALYWYFVDSVWMFIFPLLYLLSVPGR